MFGSIFDADRTIINNYSSIDGGATICVLF